MNRAGMEQGKRRKPKRFYDYSLLFLTIFMVCFGLVMIYSTSSYNAQRFYGDATKFLKQQARAAVLGIAGMIVVSKIDYRIYINKLPLIRIRPIYLLYGICLLLQIVVIVAGSESGGSTRWIEFGSFRFQPSEITKIAVILFTSYIVQLSPRRLDRFTGFLRVFFFVAPLIGLVVVENFSTALIMGVIMVAICFVASRKKGYFIVCGVLFVILGCIFVFGVDYRSERIDAWLQIETHPKGYQILQGLYAIASGRIFGKGLGQSMQKLGFIPESHTDMIFSVICEELGLFGAIAVILLYILLLYRLFFIAVNSADLYGGLIATGIMAHIGVQVLLNIAVVTSTIPSTGVPLPFISYGGTSMVVLLLEMGIALSVSNQIKAEV